MNRKTNGAVPAGSAIESAAPWTSSADLSDTAQALQQAAQPMLEWFSEVQASQLAALDSCSQAVQSALEAVAVAGRPAGLLRAQGELLGTGLAQASRLQREMMSNWLSAVCTPPPQREASVLPDLSTSLDQARTSFEGAMRPWLDLWNAAANGSPRVAT